MSTLLSSQNLSKSFGGRILFQNLAFGIHEKDQIGLIGPNGAGKSTLLKILMNQEEADAGHVSKRQGLRLAYLPQTPTLDEDKSVFDEILSGAHDPSDWEATSKAYEWLSLLGFSNAGLSEHSLVSTLSGGWRKKVALAREILRAPDLLLLDEPTNHLDVESILWLEEFLARAPFATLTITHDRLFLNRISKKIWELDRRNKNGLLVIDGDYAAYCDAKDLQIAGLERQETTMRNTLRRESEWLRRGPAARTTKQQARIDRAHALADDVAELGIINRQRNVNLDFVPTEGGPKKLINAVKISKSYGDRKLFTNFDMRVERGRRIGILGANGAGKSTLIKCLLELEPVDSGRIETSETLKFAYFDQAREGLNPKDTVVKTVCPQGDHVKYRGNFVHVRSYLDRFLFAPDQMESPVSKLSGGEQARLLMARLMLKEANLLVLDEPTNDLDLATLNVLEERLKDFDGAIFLISHDRYFMDQVVDEIYAPSNEGFVQFQGLKQWEEWFRREMNSSKTKAAPGKASASTTAAKSAKKKLSYLEQREFDQMEAKIQQVEARLHELSTETLKPENLSQPLLLVKLGREMAETQKEIEALYSRWSELENKVESES
jgi:ABC transport system ATP-binding/permease protein